MMNVNVSIDVDGMMAAVCFGQFRGTGRIAFDEHSILHRSGRVKCQIRSDDGTFYYLDGIPLGRFNADVNVIDDFTAAWDFGTRGGSENRSTTKIIIPRLITVICRPE